MPKWLIVLLISLSLGLGSLLFGVEFLTRSKVDPVVDSFIEIQKKSLQVFLQDQEYLKTVAVFQKAKTQTADAGPFLNPKLYWSPLPHGPSASSELHLPEPIKQSFIRFGNDWIIHADQFAKVKVDLSFFSELAKYDHWNIEANSAIGEIIKSREFIPPGQLPIPDTLDLVMLSKLRLQRSFAKKDFLVALTEVRALALLLLSTENIHLEIAGLNILDVERKANTYWVEKGLLPEGAWQPVDRHATRRANRAIWATRGYLRLWTPAKIVETVFLGAEPPLGLCSAVNESLPSEWMLRPMLNGHWPLERDYADNYLMLGRVFLEGQHHCHIDYVSAMIKEDKFRGTLPLPVVLSWLPYSRKLFGLNYSTFHFVGFDGYQSQSPNPTF